MTLTTRTVTRFGLPAALSLALVTAPGALGLTGVAHAGEVAVDAGDPSTITLSITSDDVVFPLLGSTCTVTGTAPAGATVTLHAHRWGTAASDYSDLTTVTADSNGDWALPRTADTDYRYYATAGPEQSTTVLSAPTPLLDAPTSTTAVRGATHTLRGTSTPGSTVYVHFHRFGAPAQDYGIVRAVRARLDGTWSRPYTADVDYRFFVSRAAEDTQGDSRGWVTTR